MNILITGAAGYIGTMLTSVLCRSKLECKIYGVDNFIYDQKSLSAGLEEVYPSYVLFEQDVTKPNKFYDELIDMADIIIPLAGIVGMPACKKQPERSQAVNVDAIAYIVNKVAPHKTIIFPNTNSGYGNVPDGVCTEETPLKAISLYGRQKDKAEQIVRQHVNSVVFRLATVCGASHRHRLDLLVNTMVYEAHTKGKIGVFDADANRNYIHIEDICSAFIYAINNIDVMRDNVYNLGNDSINSTKGELANLISSVFEDRNYGKIDITTMDGSDPDKRNYRVSSQKLCDCGWVAKLDLKTAVSDLICLYDGWARMAIEAGPNGLEAMAKLQAMMTNV